MRLPAGTMKYWTREQRRARASKLQRLRMKDPVYAAKVKEYHRNRYKERAAEIKARVTAWCLENPERHAIHTKRYAKNNPEARLLDRHRRRARECMAVNTFTIAEWREIKASSPTCYYCKRQFSHRLKPTIEHIVSLNNGGTHTKDNIVAACKSCNSIKSDGTPDDLYHRLRMHGLAQLNKFDRLRRSTDLEIKIDCEVIGCIADENYKRAFDAGKAQ